LAMAPKQLANLAVGRGERVKRFELSTFTLAR
jgi:hypothetical protein